MLSPHWSWPPLLPYSYVVPLNVNVHITTLTIYVSNIFPPLMVPVHPATLDKLCDLFSLMNALGLDMPGGHPPTLDCPVQVRKTCSDI